MKNFLKKSLIFIIFVVIVTTLVWFNLDKLHLTPLKNQIMDTYLTDNKYQKLKADFEADALWNVETNANVRELNFARYSAYKHELKIYMQHSFPQKKVQRTTLEKIDKTGEIVDGNNVVVGTTNQLFPLHYNDQIFKLAQKYALSGAVDTSQLIHSPSNPHFSSPWATQENPDFSLWYINDYVQVRKESIATGFNNISETIKAWIGEDANIEQEQANVLGHRLHVFDITPTIKYTGIAKSTKTGWVMHSGVVFDQNSKLVDKCDFINLERENFSYREVNNYEVSTYYPAQHETLKFNPYICEGIVIKAYDPSDLNFELRPNTNLSEQGQAIIFKQEALPGYIIRNAKDIDSLQVQVIK